MKHRSLILLGLLMGQSQHGYQINEFIERNLNTVTDMKKPTAYATLDKLHQQGYIDIQLEQEGNRPTRKVYSINEKGREYFYQLLIENLSSAETVHYKGDIGLMFIDFLPMEKVISSLKERLEKNKKMMESLKQTPAHEIRFGVNLAVEHKIAMLEAEIAFLEKTIQKLHHAD
ncbi:PadR family transcriptional regulator [Ureibacillus sp. FSL K6-8385]|uniref:PadR family transcriptional regulator n=1 Tax=Ureibacillus terrenus TaxID=118246 RepID=A0A540V2V1_9BACL|nr:PadR family transcriptional regulator [Ureibacillus terrenus]MED3662092.1 PadR family transcriptional regulator [Ureibacillus terrenus]MED3763590.1 PadR family transcriptional regulator [Ureibacillus terrenus]TQE91076.1 PadR family transcriptional regulator [Ureibacillus terrenus]